jgi:hypothetical protein
MKNNTKYNKNKSLNKKKHNSKKRLKTKKPNQNKETKLNNNLNNNLNKRSKLKKKNNLNKKSKLKKTSKFNKRDKLLKTKKNFNLLVGGFRRKKSRLGQLITNTKKTELDFLKQHKKYANESDKYFNLYNQHIANLKELDENIPRLDSFLNIFNDIIMPKEIKPKLQVNKSLPLLFNQYNITEYSSPRDIGIEHIRQQVKYCMTIHFLPQDLRIITDVEVELNPNNVELTFVINGFKRIAHTVQHTGFQIDLSSLKFIIESIIEEVKDNIEYEFRYKPPTAKKEYIDSDDDILFKISPNFAERPVTKRIEVVGQAEEQGKLQEVEEKGLLDTDDAGLQKMLNLIPGEQLNKSTDED